MLKFSANRGDLCDMGVRVKKKGSIFTSYISVFLEVFYSIKH